MHVLGRLPNSPHDDNKSVMFLGDHDELRMGKPTTIEPSSNFCCCFLNPGVVSLLVCHQFLSPSLANPWHSLHQTRTRPDTVYICICYDIDFSLNSVTHT